MSKTAGFDLTAAHGFFSAHCFNAAWDLMEETNRTARDDQMMVALAHASIFHWSKRPDCDDQKLSIGYWQASRVQALIGNPSEATRLAEISLSYSQKLAPFFLAYAHEALARARKMMGDQAETERHLAAAGALLPLVKDGRDQLEADLWQIANS
jgi:hypothetical protein